MSRLFAARVGVLVILLLAASACARAPGGETREPLSSGVRPPPVWTDLTPAQLSSMLEAKDFFMVNVHIPYQGELPKTDAFLQFDQIGSLLEKMPGKQDKVVVYCKTGRMSKIALESLARAGYSNLYQLEGGFDSWQASGRELLMLDRSEPA